MRRVVEDIEGLPDGVVGVCVVGELRVEHYDLVLVPRIEELRNQDGPIRLVLQLGPEFTGFGEGAWGDLTEGVLRMPFERAVVVSDEVMVATAINVMKWMLRGDVRTFRNDELDAAIAWVAS